MVKPDWRNREYDILRILHESEKPLSKEEIEQKVEYKDKINDTIKRLIIQNLIRDDHTGTRPGKEEYKINNWNIVKSFLSGYESDIRADKHLEASTKQAEAAEKQATNANKQMYCTVIIGFITLVLIAFQVGLAYRQVDIVESTSKPKLAELDIAIEGDVREGYPSISIDNIKSQSQSNNRAKLNISLLNYGLSSPGSVRVDLINEPTFNIPYAMFDEGMTKQPSWISCIGECDRFALPVGKYYLTFYLTCAQPERCTRPSYTITKEICLHTTDGKSDCIKGISGPGQI